MTVIERSNLDKKRGFHLSIVIVQLSSGIRGPQRPALIAVIICCFGNTIEITRIHRKPPASLAVIDL